MSGTDYCELCDLPRSQCIHGRPPAPVEKPAPKPTTRPARPATKVPTPRRQTTARAAAPATPPKPVTRRWTPPEELKPFIVGVLEDAGGALEADALFGRLEERVGDLLRAGDRETTPEGELRWQYAARRARQQLIRDGLMTKGEPGVWQLA